MRIGVRQALYLGNRRLLAMTCRRCGRLRQGDEFGKRPCNNGRYVDRRCRTTCRWERMEANVVGRNGMQA